MRRTVLNTFISLGSCRLDYSFVLLTTAHSWKCSWELERSFAVFQEEHGPNWRSWPTSCTNFNVAGNLSTVVLSCKNVCRQLKFSKLESTSSLFFLLKDDSGYSYHQQEARQPVCPAWLLGNKSFLFLSSNIKHCTKEISRWKAREKVIAL